MVSWVAVSFGALDVGSVSSIWADADLLVLSTFPTEPIGLAAGPAKLWRRLILGPVPEVALTAQDLALVEEFADFGIASTDLNHPSRTSHISPPWLESPMHELVNGLVARVAEQESIDAVFIKGPAMFRQGLRTRQHSGDVDVWVPAHQLDRLANALVPWGWNAAPEPWSHGLINHSVTLLPDEWGCEIDLHRQFPGVGVNDDMAFRVLLDHCNELEFAGVSLRVPNRPAQASIAALHFCRPEIGQPTSEWRRTQAVDVLQQAGITSVSFLEKIGGTTVLASVIRTGFPGVPFSVSESVPINWLWRQQPDAVRAYAVALRSVPRGKRAGVLWRLVWPPREAALASDHQAGGTTRNAVVARMRRIARGVPAWGR